MTLHKFIKHDGGRIMIYSELFAAWGEFRVISCTRFTASPTEWCTGSTVTFEQSRLGLIPTRQETVELVLSAPSLVCIFSLGVWSASISWWTLNIPLYLSLSVSELPTNSCSCHVHLNVKPGQQVREKAWANYAFSVDPQQ